MSIVALFTITRTISPMTFGQVSAGAGATTTGAIGGLAAGGAIVAICTGLATIIGVFFAVAATNRKNKRDYENEIKAAKLEGKNEENERLQPVIDNQREWTEYWMNMYFGKVMPTSETRDKPRHPQPRRAEGSHD